MSYILDALRKAERERAQSATPGQGWHPAAQPSSEARYHRYRPVLVSVLCLLLAAALLITSAHDRNAAVAAAQAAAAAAAATPPAVPAASEAIDDTAMSLQQQNPATLDDVMEGDATAAAPDETSAALSAMVVHRDPPPATPAETDPAPAPAPVEAAPEPVTEVERVQLQAAPPPQVTKLRDMPAAYRTAFPTLSLDVHSYDAAATKRFIMIGGHAYHEGDTLPDGPHIAQIVPEGVVFDYRGEQVLFTIAH